jgi:alpha-L-fucosidase 2
MTHARASKIMTLGAIGVLSITGLTGLEGALPNSATAASGVTWAAIAPVLSRNVSVMTVPPTQTPGGSVTSDNLNIPDGPVMGNGDVTVAVGGTAAAQTYTMTTTDFWYKTFPVVVGSVTVNTPGFDGSASYRQEQDPGLAEVRSSFSEGTQALTVRSLTAATANLTVIQLTNPNSTPISGVSLVTKAGSIGTNYSLPITAGVDTTNGTAWVTRTTDVSGNPWIARDALATRVVGAASTVAATSASSATTTLTVGGNATVTVVVAVGGGHNSTSFLSDARTLANSQTTSTVSTAITNHRTWWQNFWTKGAAIDLGGGPVERYWYTSLYVLASANRTGQSLPGMQNIQTEDHNAWDGGWWANYDLQNTYLGVYSAGHSELSDPYDAALAQYLPTSYVHAGAADGSKGALVMGTIGPGGQDRITTDLGMNGNAAWLAMNMVNHWNTTRNASWANSSAYPWMLAAAHYWDQNLVLDATGTYNITNSAQNEGSTYVMNPIGDLSWLRALYATLLDMNTAGAVSSSPSDVSLWTTELAHLAPLPTFTYNGHTDYKATQDAPGFYGGDANPVNPATFAPVLGLGSSASELQALRNTIYDLGDNANIWYQQNSFAWIYPAAARAGLPDVFSRMSAYLTGRDGESARMQGNGTVVQTNGGGETFGSIETVNSMMLSSYDGELRFFPAWPAAHDASFTSIAATGAFTVSGAIAGGTVQTATVTSEQGQTLKVAQPWPSATITITDTAGGSPVIGSSSTVTASTTAGHSYSVAFSGGTKPAVDLATEATPSASSTISTGDWWTGYAIDGQTGSQPSTLGWTSSSNLTVDHSEYYQLDFGSTKSFNRVGLWPRSDSGNVGQGFPRSYSVSVSSDGSTWTTVATGAAAAVPSTAVVLHLLPQSARYVRVMGQSLRANPNDSNQYRMQFAEVGVYNDSSTPTDLARSSTASASSSVSAAPLWQLSNVNDGILVSSGSVNGWSSSATLNSDHSEWVGFDLGATKTFSEVDLYPRTDGVNAGYGMPSEVVIGISADGVTWTTVTDVMVTSPSSTPIYVSVGQQSARYLRTTGVHLVANPNDISQYRMQFAEVEVG